MNNKDDIIYQKVIWKAETNKLLANIQKIDFVHCSLYIPLENQRFSDVFRGYRKRPVA